MSYINPRVDLVFKKIFGSEQNEDLLISLINSIVSQEDQVQSIQLLNPYNERNFQGDKLSVLDIKAKDKNGSFYNIEIQMTDEADYDKRALYYWAKLYSGQMKEGMKYLALGKTIGIHILNFTSIPGTREYHNCFRLKEINRNFEYFEDIELHTIELSKFEESYDMSVKKMGQKIKDGLDLWVTFLTKYNLLKKEKLAGKLNTPEIRKALDVLEYLSFSEKERDEYDDRLKWLMIEASAIYKAKKDGAKEASEREKLKYDAERKLHEQKLEQERKANKQKLDQERKLSAKKLDQERKLSAKKLDQERKLSAKKLGQERKAIKNKLKNEKIEIARAMKLSGMSDSQISSIVKLSKKEISLL